MIVGMDLMTRLSRAKNWAIDHTPFVYLPKDIVLSRLLTEWTTMDEQQIQETIDVLPRVEVDLDLDSDSDGGASTVTFPDDFEVAGDDFEVPKNDNNEKRPQRSSKYKSKYGRARVPSPDGLAERFERKILPENTHSTFAQKIYPNTNPELNSSRRNVGPGHRFPSEAVPGRVEPDLTSSSQYYGSSHQTYPAFSYQMPMQGMNFQSPYPPPIPPSPPSPPRRSLHRNKDRSPETVGVHTGNEYRPGTPSMKGSTTVVDESSGASREGIDKGKDKDVPLERFREFMNEGGMSETRKTYAETSVRDDQQAERTSSRYDKLVEAMVARLVAEWEQKRSQESADLDERLASELSLKDADEQHRKHREYLQTYEKAVDKAYAELKRREEDQLHHKQEIIEAVKEQVTAELKLEQQAAAKKAEEERKAREQVDIMAEAERQRARFKDPASVQEGADQFVRQFMDRTQGDTIDNAAETYMIQDSIQRFAGPHHTEFDVMSYVTEESATNPASSVAGGAGPEDEDSDETETNETILNGQINDDQPSNSDVERSQPWKGPAYVGNSIDLNPFYLRGSDAGQTWYHGENPVYIVEFVEGYNGEDAYIDTPGSTRTGGQYLLISKLWVDAEVLQKFGFKYSVCPPSSFYLNPSLSWESIETLVNFTFYLREVETFRMFGQAKDPSLAGGRSSPPALDFFAHDKSCSNSWSSNAEPSSDKAGPESDVDHSGMERTNENQRPWALGRSLVYPLSVLNFALHTIS